MLFPEHMPKWGEYASGFGTKLTFVKRKKGESGGPLGNPDPVFVFDLKFKTLSTGFLLR